MAVYGKKTASWWINYININTYPLNAPSIKRGCFGTIDFYHVIEALSSIQCLVKDPALQSGGILIHHCDFDSSSFIIDIEKSQADATITPKMGVLADPLT